jgi:TolA-binding protein
LIKIYIYLVLLFSSYVYAEQSVFGAGDLNSPTPYGLSPTEEVIVKTKKTTTNNEKKIKKVDSKITQIYDKVDGLESLYEGDSRKLNDLSIDFKQRTTQFELLQNSSKTQNQQIELLQQDIVDLKKQLELNNKNMESLKDSFDKIVDLANKINKDYVTKEEFNKLLSMLDKKEVAAKPKSSTKSGVPNKPSRELMKEVRVLFKKDYFTKAIPILEHLISIKHRPAECNYYMGEINYYRDNYKDALHYFKTSMMLYDKASYLPKLLLHSAISFEKIGDMENAKSFYNTVVDVYPGTNEAAEASKKIK